MTRFLIPALLISTAYVTPAAAKSVNWIDWQSHQATAEGFTAYGQITSGTEVIDVTYRNKTGVGFIQTGTGVDYFTGGATNSPYTSIGPDGVDNRPPAAELIALQYAGPQTLSFSKAVANLYLSYVSLNGNGWRFDQDFKILSNTGANIDGAGADSAGYWGSGNVVRVDNGDGTYSLNSTGGEPHGTILLPDTFTMLTWTSLTNEYWNGFTVGVEGTDEQVNPAPVPLPAGAWLMLTGLGLVAGLRRRFS
ncbi:VPLPA-CTERM sorting domain-containing protein [Paracoccus sp. S3-43]|uniref:VPLPA-CTERM sorting domain-containing protein n=1 Tax=Paracoccus sp. S3-43 TaxID=3030011 RepID=UPI0023AEA059|nr:VPLPA-CTERM sorting domain-containing protein [Paracoccus sp. S3-43]WEF24257.1 VPLPA-CTERM sorting domain-containing protein [Paracoccus sp. S3-43]